MNKWIIPLILLLSTACHSPAVFEKYEELPDEHWGRYHVVEFTAAIPDSGYYNLSLNIRHTTDYEMANLWCFLYTRGKMDKPLQDTVNIRIAEPDGKWLGKGGNIKNVQQAINRNPVFLPQGEIKIRIEQGMRIENMKGIKNVGLSIERAEKSEE